MTHQIIIHDFTPGGRKVVPHNRYPGVLHGASYKSVPEEPCKDFSTHKKTAVHRLRGRHMAKGSISKL